MKVHENHQAMPLSYCNGTLIFSITTTSCSEAVVNLGYNELN